MDTLPDTLPKLLLNTSFKSKEYQSTELGYSSDRHGQYVRPGTRDFTSMNSDSLGVLGWTAFAKMARELLTGQTSVPPRNQ